MSYDLLYKYIKEASEILKFNPEEIAYNPKRLPEEPDLPQNSTTKIKQKDKRSYSVEKVITDLIENAGPNTYMRYTNTPILKVSNSVSYSPHGLYCYPLDKKNLFSLVSTGMSTDAEFAIDYDYIHVFKINTPDKKKITFSKDKEFSKIESPFNNKSDVLNALKELIRCSNELILEEIKADEDINLRFNDILNELITKSTPNELLKIIFEKFGSYDFNSRRIITTQKEKISNFIFNFYNINIKTTNKEKVKFEYYKIILDVAKLLAIIIKDINNEKNSSKSHHGKYLSILLHFIGIDSIIDKGTGNIHPAELDQAVTQDFTGNDIENIGTYTNVFADTLNGDEDFSAFVDMFFDIINKKGITWDY